VKQMQSISALSLSLLLVNGVCFADETIAINAGNLQDDVDYYRSACIMPYYANKADDALYHEMLAKGTAEPFMTRLAIAAPANWKAIADTSIDATVRLKGAVNLLGMAISHGGEHEKMVAKAYSVFYFPVPQTDECAMPDGLSEFIVKNNFWQTPQDSH
jgi:hypothetical protein